MAYVTINPETYHNPHTVQDAVFATAGGFRQLRLKFEREQKIRRRNQWRNKTWRKF